MIIYSLDLVSVVTWGSFGGLIAISVLSFIAALAMYYSRQDSEMAAGRFRCKKLYLLGRPEAWRMRYKYAPLLLFLLGVLFLIVAMIMLFILVF